jgi:nucleotide-binding universal stress UspA family protein
VYQHILVALDGSALAEQVLPHVEALARKFQSRVTLLQVTASAAEIIASTAVGEPVGAVPIDPEPIVEAEQERAESYLEDLARELRSHGLTVDHEEVEGPVTDAILRRAAADGADLIAMATHGRGGLSRLFFGSTTEDVLRHAACPLLLVRVTDEAAG